MELANNELLKIEIDNYSGPLDVLLTLAKTQKVDLGSISITQLADQFIEFINREKEINLDLASEFFTYGYLVNVPQIKTFITRR